MWYPRHRPSLTLNIKFFLKLRAHNKNFMTIWLCQHLTWWFFWFSLIILHRYKTCFQRDKNCCGCLHSSLLELVLIQTITHIHYSPVILTLWQLLVFDNYLYLSYQKYWKLNLWGHLVECDKFLSNLGSHMSIYCYLGLSQIISWSNSSSHIFTYLWRLEWLYIPSYNRIGYEDRYFYLYFNHS